MAAATRPRTEEQPQAHLALEHTVAGLLDGSQYLVGSAIKKGGEFPSFFIAVKSKKYYAPTLFQLGVNSRHLHIFDRNFKILGFFELGGKILG